MPQAFECYTCEMIFSSWRTRQEHCECTGHRPPSYECDRCDRWFDSEIARYEHMSSYNHFKHECDICYETYASREQRKEHEIKSHHYCYECDRYFPSWNNIRAHLKSRAHLPANGVTCPFCKAGYTSATGVAHHLEMDGCSKAPNVDRDTLYEYIRSKDPGGVITKELVTHGSHTQEATNRAWNGNAYECYLCKKTFRRLVGLNSHLRSPYHQQRLYHCPKCRKHCKTLSALISHLASETCGYMRFDKVQTIMDSLILRGQLLT